MQTDCCAEADDTKRYKADVYVLWSTKADCRHKDTRLKDAIQRY